MRLAIHYLAVSLAGLSVLAFIACRVVAVDALDPERPIGDRLTTAMTPSARKSDFLGQGWRAYKLQWIAMVCFITMMILFGITG
jgi:hypothetical protein